MPVLLLLGAPQKIDRKSAENVDPKTRVSTQNNRVSHLPVVTNGFAPKVHAEWYLRRIQSPNGRYFHARFVPQHVWRVSGDKIFDPNPPEHLGRPPMNHAS